MSEEYCSSIYEDNDMIANCELLEGHEGHHRVNGSLGFCWTNETGMPVPKFDKKFAVWNMRETARRMHADADQLLFWADNLERES